MTRRSACAAGLLLTALLAAACGGTTSPGAPRPSTAGSPTARSDAGLDAARSGFEQTRAAALAGAAAVPVAAQRLDAVEPPASRGDVDGVRRALPPAASAAATARRAVATLPQQVTAYAEAVSRLDAAAATPGLSAAQAAALRGLAAAARGEVAALQALADGQRTGWPAYSSLLAQEQLWLTRAEAGYYPDPQSDSYSARVAGEAFVVLVNPVRDALDRERSALADGTGRLGAARQQVATALTAVQRVLS